MGKTKNPSAKRVRAATKSDGETFPSFDENALSALTEKIEMGLGKKSALTQDSGPATPGKKQDGKGEAKLKKSNAHGKERGTKRDAQGNAKKSDFHNQSTRHKKDKVKDDGSVLLQEILALGGTEDDLDLVAGAASDDEEISSAAPDKELQKELAKFVASLGIEGAEAGEASESEAEDDWEETSELESSVAQAKTASKLPAPAAVPAINKSEVSSKDANRLVSPYTLQPIV